MYYIKLAKLLQISHHYIVRGKKLVGAASSSIIYVLLIMLALIVVGGNLTNGLIPERKFTDSSTPVIPEPPKNTGDNKNLQLYTFGYTTPAPTLPPPPPATTSAPRPPSGTCPSDAIKTPGCGACSAFEMVACDEKPCKSPGVTMSEIFDPQFAKYNCTYRKPSDPEIYEQKRTQPHCVEACFAKPVIYLYPVVPTLVDVEVITSGKIFVSDPLYPEGGWKNVLAFPDGRLIYQGKKYQELFYESEVGKVNAPDTGIVIKREDLKKELNVAIAKIGLNNWERKEFLDFWVPRLTDLDSPYILFSIIDPVEKERTDHVNITPVPDTRIEFIAYFKPLQARSDNLKPLILPDNPPKRIGFTAVEWGGTIDTN